MARKNRKDSGNTIDADDRNDKVTPVEDADVSPLERSLLAKAARTGPDSEDEVLNEASLDSIDEDGDPLEEKTLKNDLSGEDLDVPGSEEDNEEEEIGEEDEENNVPEKNKAVTPEETILSAEDRLNSEIEELLALLGLSESMVQVTNEMLTPPEGHWDAPEGQRAIINPGGVGQPRDGDPRAAFMIFDTEEGFEFYRIPYAFNKTQEKIIKVGLPQYLAVRLAYGR